jgi:type VII secretion-associated protein (TIGR03931 family)
MLVASVEGRLSSRRIWPVLPTGSASDAVRAELGGRVAEELVVVHPSHWTPAAVGAALRGFRPFAEVVRACPAAFALARELNASARLPPGPLAVLEVGHGGVGVSVLADLASGRVLAGRFTERAERPAELLAHAARVAGFAPPELTGGVLLSRTELASRAGGTEAQLASRAGGTEAVPTSDPDLDLEELTDLVGEPPLVPDDPAAASVLGALRPPPERAGYPRPASTGRPARAPTPAWGQLGAGLLVPPPRPGRLRPVLCGVGIPVLAALLTVLLSAAGSGNADVAGDPARWAEQGRLLAQYDYLLALPAGWRHSGGLPERRRTLLTPAGAPEGSDLISVEQTPLGYDSGAERDRAFREFRDAYRHSRADDPTLGELTLSTRLAGRDLIAYQQRQPVRGAEVDWYVLFQRDAQISVGCQHTPARADLVRTACAEVIGSLRPRF